MPIMAQEILVLGVKRYGFTNEDNGEKIEGTTIFYLEDFEYPFNESNMKGVFPLNVTANNMEFFNKFPQLPAYYNVVFRSKPDKKGKPVSVPVDATFSRSLNLSNDIVPDLKVAKVSQQSLLLLMITQNGFIIILKIFFITYNFHSRCLLKYLKTFQKPS